MAADASSATLPGRFHPDSGSHRPTDLSGVHALRVERTRRLYCAPPRPATAISTRSPMTSVDKVFAGDARCQQQRASRAKPRVLE